MVWQVSVGIAAAASCVVGVGMLLSLLLFMPKLLSLSCLSYGSVRQTAPSAFTEHARIDTP